MEMLADICWLKSERLESDYQDAKSALLWRRAERYFEQGAQAVPVSAVSLHARRCPATAGELIGRWQQFVALCQELRERQPIN